MLSPANNFYCYHLSKNIKENMSIPFDLGGVGMWDEEGRQFYVGKQVIFQNVHAYDHQVDGDIGVIVSIANEPDERDHQDYMAVWLYICRKFVRAFEGDVYIIKDQMTASMMMSIKCCMTLTGG